MPEGEDWCCYHRRYEPVQWRLPGWRICGECWHYYRSQLHLRLAHVRMCWHIYTRAEWWYRLRAFWRPIHSCPHCSHDF